MRSTLDSTLPWWIAGPLLGAVIIRAGATAGPDPASGFVPSADGSCWGCPLTQKGSNEWLITARS
jgi:hypothetical protein